jgi:predicted DNA-binding helix-hairpin-helix protein
MLCVMQGLCRQALKKENKRSIIIDMNGFEKLTCLEDLPSDEIDGGEQGLFSTPRGCLRIPARESKPEAANKLKDPARQNIHRAILPGGGSIPLLKTMQTSICENNCRYCAFRAGRDFRRVTFSPDEMALTFLALQRAGIVEGLFLSSGVVNGGGASQDRILATAELLRKRHHYSGYLHLKLMPGSQKGQLEQAVLLADRVSINLESPNPGRLALLAPQKAFNEELLKPFEWMADMRKNLDQHKAWRGRWPSITTQFVVGGVGESDLELLLTTVQLMKNYHMSRAYFSGFNPVARTPLEDVPRADPWRLVRLYQASYLVRDYGYEVENLTLGPDRNLPVERDPKLVWADNNLAGNPVELNLADRQELLRIPGIGPLGASRVLRERARGCRLTEPGQLEKLGIHANRTLPYILLNGRRPVCQPALF